MTLPKIENHIHDGIDSPKIIHSNLVGNPTIPTYQDSEWVISSDITNTFYTSTATIAKNNGTALASASIIIYTHDDVDGIVSLSVEQKQAGSDSGADYNNDYDILLNAVSQDTGSTTGGTDGLWSEQYADANLAIANGDTITVRAVMGTTNRQTDWRIILKGGKVIAPTEFSTTYP